MMAWLVTEIRGLIPLAFQGRLADMTAINELFIEIYNRFENRIPERDEILQIIYWYVSDYSDQTVTGRTREKLDPALSFYRDIIMKAPSPDMMNTLARSVLTLYSYDENANDISIPNVLRQCLQLIALFPLISVYGYQAYRHYHDGQSLFIHMPQPDLSTAENILYCLRADSKYTELEAKILDLALVLHAEHGGGKQLYLYHPRGHLLRHRYLFRHRGGPGISEGTQARRRQH